MADSDNDPTTATPVGRTLPLPPAPEPAAGPARGSGWRSGQVAVVAVLALLLGGAGATLAWLASDEGEAEPAGTATATSTTSEGAANRSASTSTTSLTTTSTTRRGGSSTQSGGQTVVGNGGFTGSYQSNSDQSTDDFSVDDNWKIRWDVPGGAVTIEIFDSAGERFKAIDARGEGEFVVAEGGTYRLDISTDGSRYSVAVTDGP